MTAMGRSDARSGSIPSPEPGVTVGSKSSPRAGRGALAAAVLAATLAGVASPARPEVLLVHLPSSPTESAGRLVEGVGELVEHLAAEAPGIITEPLVFRRLDDARATLATRSGSVALVLVDAGFLLDPPAVTLVPGHRVLRGGHGTYRRLVVVRAGDPARAVGDLRRRTLGMAESTGPDRLNRFIEHAVFAGEVTPERFFAELVTVADDLAAAAGVLYRQTDAALIAEHNPLLAAHRDELAVLYASPPLSLPVLAYNPAVVGAAERRRLARALADLRRTSSGRRARELLAIDGFEPVAATLAESLLALPSSAIKTLTVALPADAGLPSSSPPPPGELRFVLPLTLPAVAEPGDER